MSVLSVAAAALPVPSLLEEHVRVPDHVVMGSSPRVLTRALRYGINLGIWLRERRSVGRTATQHQARRALFDRAAAAPLAIDTIVDATRPGFGQAVVPSSVDSDIRAALADDVERLVALVYRLSGVRHLRVKLHRCDGDECRQFHVDHVPLRVITTYAGPGTDWLEDGAARREHLGGKGLPRHRSVDDVNNAIVADWTRVHRLPRFAVALFRGAVAHGAGAPMAGIIHRSPPIAGTGIKRLRLVIDPADSHDACAT
jgi:hypothetical protein